MDELAIASGKDPARVSDRASSKRPLAAPSSKKPPSNSTSRRSTAKKDQKDVGVGIACATEKGSCVACCAEVEIDRDKNVIRVRHICQAFECGAILNPANLESQIQGALVQGTRPARCANRANSSRGKITNASFFTYQVPRFADLPEDRRAPGESPRSPLRRRGETPLIAVAPAIANAVLSRNGPAHPTDADEVGVSKSGFGNVRGFLNWPSHAISPMLLPFLRENDMGRSMVDQMIFIGIKGCVMVLDRRTGAGIWQTALKGSDFVNVVYDGESLFASARGELFCLDPQNGRIRWSNPLKGMGWGICTIAGDSISPIAQRRAVEAQRLGGFRCVTRAVQKEST